MTRVNNPPLDGELARPKSAIRTGPAGEPYTLAIDIGGSGIKVMLLDPAGEAVSERLRVATPRPATPEAVLEAISGLARGTVAEAGAFHRVSVGFPGVVRDGMTVSAPNLDEGWPGFALEASLRDLLGAPVRVGNDANIQGLGVIRGTGVELVLTLGTGLGSGLYIDGHAVPNLELAHHPFRAGKTYEELLGEAARKRDKKKWNKSLRKALVALEALFYYDRVYLGGGNARKIEGALPERAELISNRAGLTGGIALWRDQP